MVKVVVVTSGDLEGKSGGLTREGESVSALTYFGLDTQSVILFGYGDQLLSPPARFAPPD
jgi:LmbE family N-acetylglucosaminyl deacetylase